MILLTVLGETLNCFAIDFSDLASFNSSLIASLTSFEIEQLESTIFKL